MCPWPNTNFYLGAGHVTMTFYAQKLLAAARKGHASRNIFSFGYCNGSDRPGFADTGAAFYVKRPSGGPLFSDPICGFTHRDLFYEPIRKAKQFPRGGGARLGIDGGRRPDDEYRQFFGLPHRLFDKWLRHLVDAFL